MSSRGTPSQCSSPRARKIPACRLRDLRTLRGRQTRVRCVATRLRGRRSPDFHHHERAIVGDRSALRELLHVVEQAVGDIAGGERAVCFDQSTPAAAMPKKLPSGSVASESPSEWKTRMSPGSRIIVHSS